MNWPEIRKQIGDQLAHLAMGIVSIYTIAWLVDWLISPDAALLIAVGITCAWEAFREGTQYPSHQHPWDTYLDGAFEVAGVTAGIAIWTMLN